MSDETNETLSRLRQEAGASPSGHDIANEVAQIGLMLLEKNRRYGDSALDPVRIFSRADSVEQIRVRIDDKLSRLRSAQADDDEDVVDDLIGYLILLRLAQRRASEADSE